MAAERRMVKMLCRHCGALALADRPMIIGGGKSSAGPLACCYVARLYGVCLGGADVQGAGGVPDAVGGSGPTWRNTGMSAGFRARRDAAPAGVDGIGVLWPPARIAQAMDQIRGRLGEDAVPARPRLGIARGQQLGAWLRGRCMPHLARIEYSPCRSPMSRETPLSSRCMPSS